MVLELDETLALHEYIWRGDTFSLALAISPCKKSVNDTAYLVVANPPLVEIK